MFDRIATSPPTSQVGKKLQKTVRRRGSNPRPHLTEREGEYRPRTHRVVVLNKRRCFFHIYNTHLSFLNFLLSARLIENSQSDEQLKRSFLIKREMTMAMPNPIQPVETPIVTGSTIFVSIQIDLYLKIRKGS